MPLLLSPTPPSPDLLDRLAASPRSRAALALTGGFALAAAVVVLLVAEGIVDRFADLPALVCAASARIRSSGWVLLPCYADFGILV